MLCTLMVLVAILTLTERRRGEDCLPKPVERGEGESGP